MKRRIIVVALVMMFGFVLASCKQTTPEVTLTSITISGADDVTLDFDATFNVLTGVTALGNDGVDYTSSITYTTTATVTNDLLDTTKVGVAAIRYDVRVDDIVAQRWRYVTVNSPQAVEGEMLVNPNFDNGTAGWDDPSVVYNADGSSLTLSNDNGALKAEVVAGANPYTPRFGQMNVPFEMGKTYEVSFDAKSSVDKTINLQVGELLSGAPYFTDFKPGLTVHKLITTDWATYSYKFTMNLDNQRGGVLFELGKIGEEQIDATMWFDNIKIEEATPDPDTTAPDFTGVAETVTILVGGTFDPLNGVSAFDVVDGDLTDNIAVTIFKNLDGGGVELATSVDTSVEGVTYTIYYSVVDSSMNVATAETTVSVVGLIFQATNLVADPSFESEFDTTTPEWALWVQDWGAAPEVTPTLDTTAGTYSLDIAGGGDASWAIQLYQDGYITLEEGQTYKLSFTASATVDRSVSVALGYDPGTGWIEYGRLNGIAVTTTDDTYEYLFTVTQPTHAVKLVFELGSQTGFADGVLTFSDVSLNALDQQPIVMNSNFDMVLAPWETWTQNWGAMPTVSFDVVNDQMVMTTDLGGDAGWAIQFNQPGIALENGKTYVLSFDAMASAARDLNVAIFVPGVYTSYLRQDGVMLTTTMATYSYEFTVAEADNAALLLSFEMGATAAFAAGSITLDNVSLVEKDNASAPQLVKNGTFDQVMYHNFFDENGNSWGYVADGVAFVVDTLGGAAYQPHYYYLIDQLAAGNYTVTFTMSSSVARDFRFNIILPDAGYASILPDTKYDFSLNADEATTVTINFTVDTPLTNVKVELDFGTLGDPLVSLPGTFTLQQLLIYPNFN